MAINIVNLTGYAGRDPDVHSFEDGKICCRFPILVRSNHGSGTTLFESIDLELWNKTAEVAVKYVPKGRLIGITGSLKFSHWLDRKTGKTRHQPIVLVNQIYLLGAKADSQLNHTHISQPNQRSKSFTKLTYQNLYEEDYNEYEYEEDFDDSYYEECEEYDTSMDYGYLDDMDSVYEHFHSFGDIE